MRWCRIALVWLGILGVSLLSTSALTGCQTGRLTDQIVITEGPQLNYGRMSATLGAVRLKDGTIVVVGGSPSESKFVPHTGKKAIELLRPPYTKWEVGNVDVKYPLAGNAHLLPDGRLLVFSSLFIFDAYNNDTKAKVKENMADPGFVSAVIIDLKSKKVTPIYRPKDNKPCGKPVKGSIALTQRAFERTLALRDGRILRIGAFNYYQHPVPTPKCEKDACVYCVRGKCAPDKSKAYTCYEDKDCPQPKRGKRDFIVSPSIEIYSPPTSKKPLGSVKCIAMEGGRTSAAAIQLNDGKVLITGGWGPLGIGENQSYDKTYLFDPTTNKLTAGTRMYVPREDHAMARLEDGRILLVGGTDGNSKTVRTSEIYDPNQGIFLPAKSMSLSREDHLAVRLGPLWIFVGGEVDDKADQIRNTAEAFYALTGEYVAPFFLYERPEEGKLDAGLAGIADGNAMPLGKNILLLFGGQQGKQDRDGDYISAGIGTVRTLRLEYRP